MKTKLKLEGLPLYVLLTLAGLAVVVAGIFYFNKGSHIRLEGNIQKVRTAATTDTTSVAVIDFHLSNPASYPFVVNNADVICETDSGEQITGRFGSTSAVKQLFQYKALELGQIFNNQLTMNTRIAPGQSLDAMVVGAFDVPEATLHSRKRLLIRIQEVDRAVTEIAEQR